MRRISLTILATVVVADLIAAARFGEQSVRGRTMTVEDILKLPQPPPDRRISYGPDPMEFGELRLPAGAGPHPVAIVIHGGCWMSQYNLDHVSSFSAALARGGIAVWTLEYRRLGDTGGGWPGTLEDVARGADYVRTLARSYPLDLHRVVAVGHSAGGHLVLWLAARHRLPRESPVYCSDPIRLRAVVSLAGVPDLRKGLAGGVCGDSIERLIGGPPTKVAARYAQASPIELIPFGTPQVLVHGALDSIVPIGLSRDYVAAAKRKGDDARLVALDEAGHFELIAPESSAWQRVEDAVHTALGGKRASGREEDGLRR